MLDIFALVVVMIAAYLGFRAGLLSTAISLAGLVAGYIAAFVFFKPVGSLLEARTALPAMVAYPVAGLVILVVVALSISMLRTFIHKRRRIKMNAGWVPPKWDLIGGAALLSIWAFGFVLLAGWVLLWLHSVNPKVPDFKDSIVGQLSCAFVGKITYIVTSSSTGDPALARAAAAVARDPAGGSASLGGVLNDKRVQGIMGRGKLTDAEVRRLAADPHLMEMAHKAGIIKTDPSKLSRAQAERELAEGLAPIAKTVSQLINNPKIKKLLADRDLRRVLESGDVGKMVKSPKFNDLTQLVWDQIAADQAAAKKR